MLELLVPAGSPEHVRAAVANGANAVYLGVGDFNARRRAKNFTPGELSEAVEYCHIWGVKVYLTLNTLVTDRELPAALETAKLANDVGVDALLVQDLGLARAVHAVYPDLPLHASTQMTIHTAHGARLCAELGMTRVVLARELDRDSIALIHAICPVELETFVHGALCMCYSGQCFFSSLLGGRSGNRGLCAQPCRLPYNDGNPLSLKDMSLASHLKELEEIGVSCVKIEGRMKRPEYVAVVTRVYAAALREGRAPSEEELRQLAAVFSRSGFTDGYFTGQKGPEMFGVRAEEPADHALYAQARQSYEKPPEPRVPVSFLVILKPNEPIQGVVADDTYSFSAQGPIPEPARTHALTEQDVVEQMSKTGGTPYYVHAACAFPAPGLSVPKSALNALRRELLEGLTALRAAPPQRRTCPLPPLPPVPPAPTAPQAVFTLRTADQLTPALWRLPHRRIDLPMEEFFRDRDRVAAALSEGARLSVALPRIAFDRADSSIWTQLEGIRALGVTHALIPTWDRLFRAKFLGFTCHGGFGLGTYNSRTLAAMADLGFVSATASFELKMAAIRDLSKPLPVEAIVYGRLPLMCMEQWPGGVPTDRLTDRRGVEFPVLPASDKRAELLNSQVLYLADKPDYRTCGLAAYRLLFTLESPEDCVRIAQEYAGIRPPAPPQAFTRGLYYRNVE